MKNNEYNIVNVTNEKTNFSAEYTAAQKAEFSFQAENSTTIKDELNDNQTINDNPEENLLKSTKEKEEKKQENKELESSSTSGAEASTTSGASAAASSAGGTVAGIAATAATAAVVVIGAVAGVSIIEQQKEQEDLITFVSSEIGSNNVDLVFSMPANLLSYGENPEYESSKEVVAFVQNSDGFDETYYPEVIEESYDSPYLLYSLKIDELSAATSYALTITLLEYIYTETQEVVENPTQLAFRSFTTLPVSQLITFTQFDVTYNSVEFAFIVAFSDVGYVPGGEVPSAYAKLGDRTLSLTQMSIIDDEHAEVRGGFTGLNPETSYTLEIYVETDSGDKFLGSRSFTTPERTSSVVFGDINVERTYMSFSFTVAKEDIDYVEGSTPAVQMIVSDNSDYYQEVWLQEYEEYDENTIQGWGSFSDLTLNSSFDLIIKLSRQSEFIELGSTTFDNYSGFRWIIDPTKQVKATTTFYNFAIKKAYIGYISDEETPDVIDQIHAEVMLKEGGSAGAYRLDAIHNQDTEYCTCLGNIDGLNPETDYILNIYYQPGNEDYELLGSCDFTTTESPGGLRIGDIESSDSWANIPFEINSSEVDLSGQDSNIRVLISFGSTVITGVTVSSSSFTEKSGTDKLEASVHVDNLPANTIFYAEVNNATTGGSYGGKTFATSQSDYGFQVTNLIATSGSVTVEFTIDPNGFSIDWTDQSEIASLEDQLYLDYTDGSTTYQPQYAEGLTYTSSDDPVTGTFSISSLPSSSKFTATAYYDDGAGTFDSLNMFEFTTNDGVTNVEGGPNNSFYVVEDGDSAYRMPIRITYTGGGSDFGENFIINLTTEGMAQPITASVSVREGYQYALFDELTISRYFGETMTFTITCDEDTDTVLYEDQATIVDVSSSGTNTFFDATDLTTDLYSGNSVNFSLFPVCALGVPSLLEDATLVITGGNLSLEYELDLSTFGYASSVSVDLLVDKNNTSLSYSTLKNEWRYLPLTIEIVYRTSATTGDTTTFVVASEFMFNFVD